MTAGYNLEDTIVAVSTPPGRGAIGIVRISGPRAREMVCRVFRPYRAISSDGLPPRRPVLGSILHPADRQPLDEAFVLFFPGPRSFTGEDLIEIHAHGNPVVLEEIIRVLIQQGARLAQPGEFAYRAFVHGKIDLVQAEALNDLIRAHAIWQARAALQHLEGRLSDVVRKWKHDLVELIARFEATVDFGETENIDFLEPSEATQRFQHLIDTLESLLQTFQHGRALREGLRVVIVGKPNVGKSSLFNALLREPRAIVTPVAGTTRDFITEHLIVDGFAVELIDTAGVRETVEMVEQIGVERTLTLVEQADLILWVVDGTVPLDEEDDAVFEAIRDKPLCVVRNKSDAPSAWPLSAFPERYGLTVDVTTSCKTGEGIGTVMDRIREVIRTAQRAWHQEETVVTNVRHKTCLRRAWKALRRAQYRHRIHAPEPIVLEDLREALRAMDEMTGETDVEEILDRIFSQFCIGK